MNFKKAAQSWADEADRLAYSEVYADVYGARQTCSLCEMLERDATSKPTTTCQICKTPMCERHLKAHIPSLVR